MLMRLGRRFADRMAFNLNWTWSKSMNLVDNDSDTVRNPYDMRMSWAPAGYDMTHVFSIDYIFQLPGVSGRLDNMVMRAIMNGWQLSGITRFQTGRPFTVSSNGNIMGVDAGGVQPDVIGDPYGGRSKYRWLDPTAFRRPLDGQYGTLGRNALRYPGTANFDVNIAKTFRVTEAVSFDVRGEVYNVFNHPQIWGLNTSFTADNPGGTISSSNRNLGLPTQWRDPRVIQFGFKLRF